MPAEPLQQTPNSAAERFTPVPVWLARLLQLNGSIGHAEEWLGIVLVAVMAIVINLQVIARYAFDNPFIWAEEVSRLLLVWMTFLGAAALIRRGGDIAVDTFIDMLSPAQRRAALLVRDLLIVAVYCLVAWQGWRLAGNVAGMPLVATEWPTALLAWPVVAGGVLVVLHVLVRRACAWAGMPALAHAAQASL